MGKIALLRYFLPNRTVKWRVCAAGSADSISGSSLRHGLKGGVDDALADDVVGEVACAICLLPEWARRAGSTTDPVGGRGGGHGLECRATAAVGCWSTGSVGGRRERGCLVARCREGIARRGRQVAGRGLEAKVAVHDAPSSHCSGLHAEVDFPDYGGTLFVIYGHLPKE